MKRRQKNEESIGAERQKEEKQHEKEEKNEERKKKLEQERWKQEKEPKKEMKIKYEQKKQNFKGKGKAVHSSYAAKSCICSVCQVDFYQDSSDLEWVGCTGCDQW